MVGRFAMSAFVAVLGAMLLLSGCSSYRPAPEAFNAATIEPYQLDSGDQLRITVFEQENLTGLYSVDQAGYIAFPLVGSVPARGQTLEELESVLAAKLRNGYLRDPDVTIQVDQYRSIFVMGEVTSAGQYAYVPGMTAQQAIAIAGGYTSRANQADVDITRRINGESITGRVPISDAVMAGDTIYVRERLF